MGRNPTIERCATVPTTSDSPPPVEAERYDHKVHTYMGSICSTIQVVERHGGGYRGDDAHDEYAQTFESLTSIATTQDADAAEPMRVIVTNLRENEAVTHPLVMVEGWVENMPVKQGSSNSNRNNISGGGCPYIQASMRERDDSPSPNHRGGLCWPVVPETGHFKAFVLLPKPGTYAIHLQIASVALVLNVRFAPIPTKYVVRFHYQKPLDSNQGFDAPVDVDNSDSAAIDRIKLNALILQTALAELLSQAGCQRRTFALELGDDGLPIVHLLRSQYSTAHARTMEDDELLLRVRQDVACTETTRHTNGDNTSSSNRHSDNGTSQLSIKHVVILGGAHFDSRTREIFGHKELADGNLVVFGSCGLHTWPRALSELTACCLNNTRFLPQVFLRDCAGRGSYWTKYASALSRLLQLLGSSFGLTDQREGIMRPRFHQLNRLLAVLEPTAFVHVSTFSHPIGDGRFSLLDPTALVAVGAGGDDQDHVYLDELSIDTLVVNQRDLTQPMWISVELLIIPSIASQPSHFEKRAVMETTEAVTEAASAVRVEIANLRDNERLLYPLVLVEGYVVLAADGPPVQFIDTGLAAEAPDASVFSWPVVPETGHFKAFVMLPRPGKHDIHLHVRGSLARVLTVRYARPNTKHFARFHYQQEPNATRGFDAPPGVDNSDEAALKRVRLGALLTQTCIAELYHKQGLPRATIALEFDDSVECQMPLANLLMAQVDPDNPIDSIQDALNLQNASSRENGVTLSHFVHVGSNHYDPETEQVAGHCAHVYGNSFIFSSVTLYAWPSTLDELAKCCLDNTKIDTSILQDDSVERGTFWANFATGLGVFMHLFLRSTRVYDNGEGIFGRGFDNVNRLLSVYEPMYESSHPAITNLSLREEGSEGDSSAPPLELNYDVLEPVGVDMEGAYVDEATLHSLTEVCPFITSASKLTQAQKNAAAAA